MFVLSKPTTIGTLAVVVSLSVGVLLGACSGTQGSASSPTEVAVAGTRTSVTPVTGTPTSSDAVLRSMDRDYAHTMAPLYAKGIALAADMTKMEQNTIHVGGGVPSQPPRYRGTPEDLVPDTTELPVFGAAPGAATSRWEVWYQEISETGNGVYLIGYHLPATPSRPERFRNYVVLLYDTAKRADESWVQQRPDPKTASPINAPQIGDESQTTNWGSSQEWPYRVFARRAN